MRYLCWILLAVVLFARPANAQWNHVYANEAQGYYDDRGRWHGSGYYGNRSYYNGNRYYYNDYRGYRYDPVRRHKRRRNVLLGVGAVGLVTGSGVLTGVGLGGAAANEIIDRRNRDW
jgi:hypothetical protein